MSGSETGVISSGEHFTIGLQKNSVPSQQPVMQSMHLPFGADGVYKPVATASPTYQSSSVGVAGNAGADGSARDAFVNMNSQSEPVKRKRGRPRKYGPDGSMAVAPAVRPAAATQSSGGFSPSPTAAPQSGRSASPTSLKKPRGRPPGSSTKKHHLDTSESAGVGFTPHVITVKAGEDVSSKIMSFSQNGPRAVCILTANGAISNVTLRQPAMSGGTVTYEGRFEILSLSGSYLLSENGGQRSRTGGLSVSLSGPDGRVLGGGVAGLLTAASPVQVVVGSFVTDGGHKELRQVNQIEQPPVSAPHKLAPIRAGMTGASSPPSRGTLSESSGGPGSPFNQSAGACNNNTIPWK
ncbi:AT-hook motif nuclear-localized protein 10 [Cucumis sativus]|uniref:AT-hook motif nuclear-localized protein n=1 Tax=Cucumis sativus TaxID=3659 RepID=A0A0A0L0T7_CUCSA|nr:AT-hook motif nuclear-localized protein 10 [Cucumis sativus]XP_011654287.1 AT-hook motif nuclear-localized protein 10 [Cucumis sativus]KGN55540.1 hypothetical protein Csa_012211 [Cucumis sativus]